MAQQVRSRGLQPAPDCSAEALHSIIAPPLHLSLAESYCQFNTTVSYSQSSAGSAQSSYVITFSMDGLAEVDPSGQIVQYSNFSWVVPVIHFGNITDGRGSDGINVSANVTAATGEWTPSGVSGLGIHQAGPVVGRISIQRVLLFQVSPADPNILEFNVDLSEWPWENPADHLGLLVGATAEPGAHFVWNTASQNLTEELNSGGGQVVGLRLDSSASTFGSGQGPSSVSVSCSAGLYPEYAQTQNANLLINFTGGNEGYTVLHYDPWIIFSPSTSSPAGAAPIDMTAILVIVAGSAAAVLLGVVALRARRTAPETGMSPLHSSALD